MPSQKNPSVRVNWDAGEAHFIVGERLEAEYPLFKVDVLGDLKAQTAWAYEAAFEELYPLLRERVQRRFNFQRRATAETLVGQTIKTATTLRNGHVALELSDGRTLVLCTNAADVHLKLVDDVATALAYAAPRTQIKPYKG